MVGTVKVKTLQVIADELGVSYYDFRGVKQIVVDNFCGHDMVFYAPMAKVYERGCWRWVVIGGRPYRQAITAQSVVEDAEKTQEIFLRAMDEAKISSGNLRGLTNPVDHWKPCLELI